MNMGRRIFSQGICMCNEDVSIRCEVCLTRMAKESPDQCTVCHRPWNPNAIQFVHINRTSNWDEFKRQYNDFFNTITILILAFVLMFTSILYLPGASIHFRHHVVERLHSKDTQPLALVFEVFGKLSLLLLTIVNLIILLFFVGQYVSIVIMILCYCLYLPFANRHIRELVDAIVLEDANNQVYPQ